MKKIILYTMLLALPFAVFAQKKANDDVYYSPENKTSKGGRYTVASPEGQQAPAEEGKKQIDTTVQAPALELDCGSMVVIEAMPGYYTGCWDYKCCNQYLPYVFTANFVSWDAKSKKWVNCRKMANIVLPFSELSNRIGAYFTVWGPTYHLVLKVAPFLHTEGNYKKFKDYYTVTGIVETANQVW